MATVSKFQFYGCSTLSYVLLRISDLVRELLYGEDGYYTKYVSIGKNGDFFTASHTSPIFGWTVGEFLKRNAVRFFVEIGGGEGYLTMDILEWTDLKGAIYEISPRLLEIQAKRLNVFKDRFRHVQEFVEADAYVLNEVLDSLPFNRFVFKDGRWWEVIYDGEFKLVEGKPEDFEVEVFEGFIYDETYGLEEFLKGFLEKTEKVLIFDYGYEDEDFKIFAPRGTLSGYKEHKVFYGLDALKKGMDITHFVNLSRIKRIAKKLGFDVKVFLPQSEFLLRYGIFEIFERLDEEKRIEISQGMKTLLFQFKNHFALFLERAR